MLLESKSRPSENEHLENMKNINKLGLKCRFLIKLSALCQNLNSLQFLEKQTKSVFLSLRFLALNIYLNVDMEYLR